jgi:hypothetical protein
MAWPSAPQTLKTNKCHLKPDLGGVGVGFRIFFRYFLKSETILYYPFLPLWPSSGSKLKLCQKSFPENCSEVSHGKTARPIFFTSLSTLGNLSDYPYAEYRQSGHYRTPYLSVPVKLDFREVIYFGPGHPLDIL